MALSILIQSSRVKNCPQLPFQLKLEYAFVVPVSIPSASQETLATICFLNLFVNAMCFLDYPELCPHLQSTTPALLITLFVSLISFSCLLFVPLQLSVSPMLFKFSLSCVPCRLVSLPQCLQLAGRCLSESQQGEGGGVGWHH